MLALMKWADIFSWYILWMMMVYLTDVWKLNFTHAAGIINIWVGLAKVLPIALAQIADAFVGNFSVLLLSSVCYSVGLGLIWMSTPPVLATSHGNCSDYKPECIGNLQQQLLYAGLALTAVGMAGQTTNHAAFLAEQPNNEDKCGCNIFECYCCCLRCRVNLLGVAALLVVAFVKPWAVLFGISAIFGVVTLFLLLIRMCWYNYVGPQGSKLTTIFRVLYAGFSKAFYRRPKDVNELYENHNLDASSLLPHTEYLRFLDKAAVTQDQLTLPQQIRSRWKLCRVTEVEETKAFIRMIPLWMTFILCGIISSLGATYFLEQAKSLNPKSGRGKIPLILFFWLYALFRSFFNFLFLGTFNLITQFSGLRNRYLPRVGITVSMFFAVFCCIAAARVETRRLGIVKSHGLIDKPDERVPLNVFTLLPQFILLAASDGIYYVSSACYILDQAPLSMVKCFSYVTYGFFGVGFMGNALCVYIFGEISEKASGRSWFQSTLNTSRLDNYYWVLAALAAGNLLLHIVIAIFYRFRESRLDQYPVLDVTIDDSGY